MRSVTVFPNHHRVFVGAEAAAPPAEIPVPGGQDPNASVSRVPERPPTHQLRNWHRHDSVVTTPGVGTILHQREELGFEAKTAIISNTSGSTLTLEGTDLRIPTVSNFVVRFYPYIDHYQATVFTSAAGAGELDVIFLEEELEPTQFFPATLSVGASVTVSSTVTPTGANHHTASVITIAAGVGSLAARATRTGGVLRARKANVADIVVEASAFHLQPGDALVISAIDLYSFTGTNGDILDVYEEYN